MATTININEAAEAVKTNEAAALKGLKAKLDQLFDDLAEIEQTLPTSLQIDASRIVNEIRSNLSYVRDASLPQAMYRYEPAAPTGMPAYAPVPASSAPSTEETGNG